MLEIITFYPSIYTLNHPDIIVCSFMETFIGLKRVIVFRYGETNLRYANYRLSDVRDYKMKALDRIPIYDNNVSPDDSVNADLLVNVPIFTEKLDGR